jgi:hypothetical protein
VCWHVDLLDSVRQGFTGRRLAAMQPLHVDARVGG